jgi:hypothetical protein
MSDLMTDLKALRDKWQLVKNGDMIFKAYYASAFADTLDSIIREYESRPGYLGGPKSLGE